TGNPARKSPALCITPGSTCNPRIDIGLTSQMSMCSRFRSLDCRQPHYLNPGHDLPLAEPALIGLYGKAGGRAGAFDLQVMGLEINEVDNPTLLIQEGCRQRQRRIFHPQTLTLEFGESEQHAG